MEKPAVYLSRTENRIPFVNWVMEKFRSDFREGMKVLVKPNLVSHEEYPTTTHPEVLASVLDFLIQSGCRIIVADGPAVDLRITRKELGAHPLAEVCRARGVALEDVREHPFKKFKTESMSLEISALAFDCDHMISLPVLKPHKWTSMTGALKNQFGLLRNRERVMMHSKLKSLGKGIAEVNRVIKANLFIVDAIETYEQANERRHGGNRIKLGYMLAGKDPVHWTPVVCSC
ncbi:MAG: DUF362 domain-containing protein [Dehalococcoidia bacterium]|nr:DUF362 domain-containing protein [Dehalococcoidia bacterium]